MKEKEMIITVFFKRGIENILTPVALVIRKLYRRNCENYSRRREISIFVNRCV